MSLSVYFSTYFVVESFFQFAQSSSSSIYIYIYFSGELVKSNVFMFAIFAIKHMVRLRICEPIYADTLDKNRLLATGRIVKNALRDRMNCKDIDERIQVKL